MHGISPTSRAYNEAARYLNMHSVCLIGWEGPRPRAFGDNRGIWPVRIATSKKEMTAADRSDIETPHVGVIVLEYVHVETKAHAERLKSALDEVLLGQMEEQGNDPLRHRWRDVQGCFEENDETSLRLWWLVILEEAQRILRERRSIVDRINTLDADEVYRRISQRATKGRM